jgi:hypothetical protein
MVPDTVNSLVGYTARLVPSAGLLCCALVVSLALEEFPFAIGRFANPRRTPYPYQRATRISDHDDRTREEIKL